jgi:hypothetical protein
MGLDMYLEARKYVSKIDSKATTDYENPVLTEEYKKVSAFFPDYASENTGFAGAEVSMNIGYWRKANQIHNWFVNECGDGIDDCKAFYVNADKLRSLRATVEHLLDNRTDSEALKLLPTASGFFFGGTEIDEWYWQDLENTKAILDKAIRLEEDEDCSIYYQASW